MPIKASIYCSSSDTIDEKYFEEAAKCGQILARHGVECYTGGGNNGLMYALEKSVIGNGGSCIGIIPQFMIDFGWLYDGLSKIIVVETMAERKAILRHNADIFIVLAGGIGTLDELFDTLVTIQFKKSASPIIIVNTGGFYDDLLRMLDKISSENFLPHSQMNMWQAIESVEYLPQIIERLKNDSPHTEACK